MNKVLKNKLKKQAEELYAEQRHEEIIELLVQADVREEYDLALILIRAFLDLSENKDDELLDSAEMLLMLFPNSADDPRWVYQLSRAYYFKERYTEAYRELLHAEELAAEGKPFPEREEARELLELAKNEYDKVTSIKYSDMERKTVLRHITDHFGRIDKMISQKDPLGAAVDIAEILPDPKNGRDYYIFVTVGLGAHHMTVPQPYNSMVTDRYELVMYMPPDLDEEMRVWTVGYMCTIGRLPIERNSWSSYGHIFSNGKPILPETKLCASTLIEVQDADEYASEIYLPGGDTVTVYQLFPLYREEVEYKLKHGLSELIKIMPHISAVLDRGRENVCLSADDNTREQNGNSADIQPDDELSEDGVQKTENQPLLLKETDYVSRLGVGELCAASRMISEKGYRVGYMRRFLIDRDGGTEIHGDSGWLFMSGHETGEYLSDPMNIEICRLNMICNIDSDIVPFLTKPYNTIISRGTDGRLHVEPDAPPDEPLS